MPHWITEIKKSSQNSDVGMFEGSENNNLDNWRELLLNCFQKHPLRAISVGEQVIRELYLEGLSNKERNEFVQYCKITYQFNPDMSNANMNDSVSVNKEETSFEYMEPLVKHLRLFQLEIISHRLPTPIRELNAFLVESLVIVPGIVLQAYKPVHKAIRMRMKCKQCESEITVSVPLWKQQIDIPKYCLSKGQNRQNNEEKCSPDSFVILSDESEYCDVQQIKLQELPEHVPTGDMPKTILLNAANILCGRVLPGERILVIGVYSTIHKSQEILSKQNTPSISYIHVLGLEYLDRTGPRKALIPTNFQNIKEFQQMAQDPQIIDKIVKSIAPAIFGSEDIKKSIACLLFGGSRKVLTDGSKLRGDINILLLGDPSTAKSQFLKFVEKTAPIAIYTSGKGSSAAGLTAAVLRDSNGNFALEGGAMVLADGGVVCIDEFDKMRDDDRVSIHEAMEQQTISIAKAGITTILTTRCSVLAAANPSFGSYDDSKETTDQHDFETTILSRFDLIWIVRDIKDVERDLTVAKHVLHLHTGMADLSTAEGPISGEKLREYINYCRSSCNPVLSPEAAKKLENYYVEIREAMRGDSRKARDQIPITIRQLESLSRISESLARMTLSRYVSPTHVEEAMHLFNLATLEAAKSTLTRETLSSSEKEKVRLAETAILQRLPVNTRASKYSIISELKMKGFEQIFIVRALSILIKRGILEEKGDASVKRVASSV